MYHKMETGAQAIYRKPFSFFSMFNLQKGPHDTSEHALLSVAT